MKKVRKGVADVLTVRRLSRVKWWRGSGRRAVVQTSLRRLIYPFAVYCSTSVQLDIKLDLESVQHAEYYILTYLIIIPNMNNFYLYCKQYENLEQV